MKLFKALIICLILSLPSAVQAQTKFGHVNTQTLLEAMPAVTKLRQHLDSMQTQYATMIKDLDAKLQKLVAEASTPEARNWSDLKKNDKRKEIEQLNDRVQGLQQDAQNEIQAETELKFKPINDLVKKAIADVAKEGKFTYIFDASSPNMLYFDGGEDILPLVKKKLNLK
ncbi:MAG: OmpH family outer membrane protein [Bacteroidota bacterium]|nr:OmpH family outer membrane protein [Bacteroidota bacterium]